MDTALYEISQWRPVKLVCRNCGAVLREDMFTYPKRSDPPVDYDSGGYFIACRDCGHPYRLPVPQTELRLVMAS